MKNSINRERLLARFLEYVRIDTTAVENAGRYPSSEGQLHLGRLLARQLQDAGAADVRHDDHGLVWATLAPTGGRANEAAPAIAWNAHLDTSPETTGANVRPQVIREYRGGDIALPGHAERVLRVAENPELLALVGKTIITTDGTTLLGADDKAGVAAIVEAAVHLLEHPEIPHGKIRLLFTCDEEIGLGVSKVNVGDLGAVVCYTLDGEGSDAIDVETFSADLATVTVSGVNIHPSIANGRMVNALRAAGALLAKLPLKTLSPEATIDRDGFLHPYTIAGGVAEVTIKVLLRDFETGGLMHKAELLRALAAETQASFPGSRIDVDISPQYRNMAAGLSREPRAVRYAQEAHRRLGREAELTIIRGGTDGSQFTAKGLPAPNLSTGEHNPHSPLEWTCLEEIAAAAELLVELAQVWGEDGEAIP